MIKLIGFLIIVLSSTKIGIDLSDKYRKRTRELRAVITVLERVKIEVGFSNCVITDALSKAMDIKVETVRNMIGYIVDMVNEKNVTLQEAFNLYMTDCNELSMEKHCTDELRRLFDMFGSGDSEDEIRNLETTILNMKTYLNNSLDDEKRYVKLYRTSGVLAGFLIAIILA